MKLAIGRADLEAICGAAEAAYPEECCGLLVGRQTEGGFAVEKVIKAANTADAPARRFEVEPGTLLAAHREARAAGQAVIGHYHSHPNGRAGPSDHDRSRAMADGEVWLIVPVTEAGAGAPGAWVFAGEDFQPIELSDPA